MNVSSNHTKVAATVRTRVFALAVTLVLALALFAPLRGANAFQPLTKNRMTLHQKSSMPSFTALFVSNREDLLEDADEENEAAVPAVIPKSAQQLHREAFWKQAKRVNNRFWDYTVIFWYVGISCLILLNVCGYGYTITKEDGLNVMPIQEYRQERQWREEMERQEQEATQRMMMVRPSSSSPLQQAPAAFLLQQQQK